MPVCVGAGAGVHRTNETDNDAGFSRLLARWMFGEGRGTAFAYKGRGTAFAYIRYLEHR